jgi:hypothetical protein
MRSGRTAATILAQPSRASGDDALHGTHADAQLAGDNFG